MPRTILEKFKLALCRNAAGEGAAGAGGEGAGAGAGGEEPGTPPPSSLIGEAGQQAETAPTQPTEPTEPTAPTEPTEPTQPVEPPAPFDAAKLELPEGVSLPEETATELAGILNNAELSPQERGQQLLALYAKTATDQAAAAASAAYAQWTQMNDQWRQEVQALPEFKGKVDAELGAVKQALIAVGAGDDFFNALNVTGAGNNPHVLSILHKLTRPYVEGGPLAGGKPASQRSAASIMYPSMTAKE